MKDSDTVKTMKHPAVQNKSCASVRQNQQTTADLPNLCLAMQMEKEGA